MTWERAIELAKGIKLQYHIQEDHHLDVSVPVFEIAKLIYGALHDRDDEVADLERQLAAAKAKADLTFTGIEKTGASVEVMLKELAEVKRQLAAEREARLKAEADVVEFQEGMKQSCVRLLEEWYMPLLDNQDEQDNLNGARLSLAKSMMAIPVAPHHSKESQRLGPGADFRTICQNTSQSILNRLAAAEAACADMQAQLTAERERWAEAKAELNQLREAISPGRLAEQEYYIKVANRMREKETRIIPMARP